MTFAEILRDYIVPFIAVSGFFFGIVSFWSKRTLKQQAQLVVKLDNMVEQTNQVKEQLTKHIIEDASVQSSIKTALEILVEDRQNPRKRNAKTK